jgi:hypothetical protein
MAETADGEIEGSSIVYYVNCTHSPYKTNVKVDRMGNFCDAIDP